MVCMALVGLLALTPPEARAGVPGTRVRFGMLESQLLGLGAFAEVKVPDAGAMTTRRGPIKFYGIPGEGTLYLSDGRLARVRIEATGVSAHSRDYVEDQFRRLRMTRTCESDTTVTRRCNWTGPVLARMQYGREKLEVVFEPKVALPTDSARARTDATARAAQATPPSRAATAPAAAAAKPPPRSTAPATAAPMLPETLTISLTSNNAANVWPRIVSAPPLEYPESARRESVQGIVWVLAVVNPDGKVRDTAIERGIPELNAAALAWVARSQFAPCERQGFPCQFRVRVAVRFTLF